MKPRHIISSILLLFCFLIAQTAETEATSRAPLSGSYDIGGVTPDYTTINAAVTDLVANGISDDVIFRLRYDVSFDEQVTINPFTRFGTGSADATVTFQSSATTNFNANWTYSGASSGSNWVVRVNGADRINFRYINFTASEPTDTYGRLIVIRNDANHITIEDNVFDGFIETTNAGSLIRGVTGSNNHTIIRNNTFTTGFRAIDLDGVDATNRTVGTIIEGNTATGQYAGGIRATTQDGAIIKGNTVNDAIFSASTYSAIYADGPSTEIANNKLDVDDGAYGIYLDDAGGGARRKIVNNMVALSGGDAQSAVQIVEFNVDIFHNTMRVDGGIFSTVALHISAGAGASPLDLPFILNNIVLNLHSGFAMLTGTTNFVGDSNHNVLYTNGAVLTQIGATQYGTLADYQAGTGLDADSASVDVAFVDVASDIKDLHLAAGTYGNADLIGTGAGVIEDIDNDPRNALSPNKGADEGTYTALDNADTTLGVYTVGGSNPDYATVNDAVAALNVRGIKGNVTFNIRGGTYATHATIANFERHNGATTNPVIFRAANPANWPTLNHPTSSSAADNWVLKIDGADHVELRQLNFEANGSANYSRMLVIGDSTADLTVDNTTFDKNTGATSAPPDGACIANDIGSATVNIEISNSDFVDCPIGLYLLGAGVLTTIHANTFAEHTSVAISSNHDDVTLTENEITGWTSFSAGGVLLADFEDFYIDSNQIHMPTGGYALWVQDATGSSTMTNNFFSSDEPVLIEDSSNITVLHNTFYATGGYALKFDANSTSQLIGSNIFRSEQNGTNDPTLILEDTSGIDTTQNNVHYSGYVGGTISWDGSTGIISDFQAATGLGTNSKPYTARFVDEANGDLHISGTSNGNSQLAVAKNFGVPDDIDGFARLATTYIGADEASMPLTSPTSVHLAETAAIAADSGQMSVGMVIVASWMGLLLVTWLAGIGIRPNHLPQHK